MNLLNLFNEVSIKTCFRFTHNASVDGVTRRTGFWLAPNARQSTITTTALETFTTELTPPADDEPIYYNSADAGAGTLE